MGAVNVTLYEYRSGKARLEDMFQVVDHDYPELDAALADVDRLTRNCQRLSYGLTPADEEQGKDVDEWLLYISAWPYLGFLRPVGGGRLENHHPEHHRTERDKHIPSTATVHTASPHIKGVRTLCFGPRPSRGSTRWPKKSPDPLKSGQLVCTRIFPNGGRRKCCVSDGDGM